MLKKATPIVVSVALSLGASSAMAGQTIAPQVKPVKPAAAAQKIDQQPSPATAAQKPEAAKAAKKIQLTKDRAIIQRKGPGHVA